MRNWSCGEVQACIGGHYNSKISSILKRINNTIKPFFYDAPKAPQNADTCSLCIKHEQRVSPTVAKLRSDLATARLLLNDIGRSTGKDNGDGMIRECFHCGITTQKDRNCASVTCKSEGNFAKGCDKRYDFIGGNRAPSDVGDHHYYHNNAIPAQQYIPTQKSLLWKVGFYAKNGGCT